MAWVQDFVLIEGTSPFIRVAGEGELEIVADFGPVGAQLSERLLRVEQLRVHGRVEEPREAVAGYLRQKEADEPISRRNDLPRCGIPPRGDEVQSPPPTPEQYPAHERVPLMDGTQALSNRDTDFAPNCHASPMRPDSWGLSCFNCFPGQVEAMSRGPAYTIRDGPQSVPDIWRRPGL